MQNSWQERLSSEGIAQVQAAQDVLADLTGVSLCLLDAEGSPLTVPSKLPPLCHRTLNQLPQVCLDTQRRSVKEAVSRLRHVTYCCHLGLTTAIVPLGVSLEECTSVPLAFLVVGKVYLQGDGTSLADAFFGADGPLLGTDDAPTIAVEQFRKTVTALGNIFSLLFVLATNCGLIVRTPASIRSASTNASRLTKREREIASMVGTGLTNQGIASRLFISDKTVKTHITNILSKLHLDNRTELAVFAIQALGMGSDVDRV